MNGIKNKKVLIAAISILSIAAIIFIFIQNRKGLKSEANSEKAISSNIVVSSANGQIILTIDSLHQKKSGIITNILIKVKHQKSFTGYGKVLQVDEISAAQMKYQKTKSGFLTAKNNYELSFNEYKRLKKLNRGNSNNIAIKTLQAANALLMNNKNILRNRRVEYDNTLNYLRQKWGEKFARDIFNNSPQFKRISAGTDLLIHITLPSGINEATNPSSATIRANGSNVKAEFISKPALTDTQIQGLSYYFIVSSNSKFILPGMNVSGELSFGAMLTGVKVPSSSIVWNKGKAWSYLEIKENQFYRHKINTGMPVKNGYFISEKDLIDKKIVVSGAQLLLSQEFKSQIKTGD